jgi:hypothetical protein
MYFTAMGGGCGMWVPMIEQYARGTVAQVQAIQALQVGQPQRNIPRSRGIDR